MSDQDFPPLAPLTRPTESTTGSRFHSLHSSVDSFTPSLIPQVPPGLGLPHAHPLPDQPVKAKAAKVDKLVVPIPPALPIVPISQKMKSAKVAESALPQSEAVGAETVHGSDKPNAPRPENKGMSQAKTDAKDSVSGSATPDSAQDDQLSKKKDVRPQLGLKTDKKVVETKKSTTTKSRSNSIHPESASTAIGSTPGTPSASTIKTSEWSSTSRPRTLRLTTTSTPKSETAPASAATERSSGVSNSLRQTSRQPSVSSASRSRPPTPTVSDRSREISRAGSPRADVSADKSRAKASKKEKKAKGKTTEIKDEQPALIPAVIEQEVGPIISRQKKKKKTQEKGEAEVKTEAESVKPKQGISRKPSPIQQPEDLPPARGGSAPASRPATPPRQMPTLASLDADFSTSPSTLRALLHTYTPSAPALAQSLFSGTRPPSSLLNPPTLSSYRLPVSQLKGAAYLDAHGYSLTTPFGTVYLGAADRRALISGKPVRLEDSTRTSDLLKRALLTPKGRVLRFLSSEDEERVLEIERGIDEMRDDFGGLVEGGWLDKPISGGGEADYGNLTGGLDVLLGDLMGFGVSAVSRSAGSDGDDDDDDDDHEDEEGDDEDEEADDDEEGGDHLDHDPGSHHPFTHLDQDHANVDDRDLDLDQDDEEAEGEDDDDEMAPFRTGFVVAPPPHPLHQRRPARRAPGAAQGSTMPSAAVLRAMDREALQRMLRETQVQMESARREMDGWEKKAGKKGKEVGRWSAGLGGKK